MRRAKIFVNKSVSGDMVYDIYKFKNKKASINLEDYREIEPISTIKEELSNDIVEFGQVADYNPTVIDHGDDYDFKIYSTPFEFLYRNNFVVFNLKNHKNEMASETISIYFNKVTISSIIFSRFNGEKYEKYNEVTDSNEICSLVVVESNRAIALAKKLTDSYRIVTMGINTRLIPFIDKKSNGVFTPVFDVVEKMNSYDLIQDRSQKNVYYYSVIAISADDKVSDVSNVEAVQLAENIENIDCVIEYSDDYFENKDKATWDKLDKVQAYKAVSISKSDIYSRKLPKLNMGEFKFDDSNLQTHGERLIMIPNIWHRGKLDFLQRHSRAYRLKNECNGEESDYSEIFYVEGKSEIKIDKMTIYKKRVTNLSEEAKKEPILTKDSDAELLKIYVRSGGLYYLDAIENTNKSPIEIVSQNSNFPILNIKDSCFYSNDYNYTVYLYDAKGNQSDPYSIVR